MSFKDRMENTEFYKSLNKVQQSVASKRQNWLAVEHDYKVACYMGFDKWKAQSKFNYVSNGVVSELLTQDADKV